MEISAEHVGCQVRHEIPPKGVTILEIISLDDIDLISSITACHIYNRPVEDCPFGRGNWCIDIRHPTGTVCIKLPKEMPSEDVMSYAKPLIDVLQAKKRREKESMN